MAHSDDFGQDHGEGGHIVGHELRGNVVIIDDVITAGTAIRESLNCMGQNTHIQAVIVALDRQERGQKQTSAIREIEQTFGFPVISIITLDHLITYLTEHDSRQQLEAMRAYRTQYGING